VSRFGTVNGTWLKHNDEAKCVVKDHATSLVAQVLSEIGMSSYSDRFAKEKLLYDQLCTLTSEDLKEMDIPLGHRKRLLAHFETLPEVFHGKSGSAADVPTELKITEVCEKPTQEYAKQKLVMTDPPLEDNMFLTMFGQYVLSPKIFEYLEEQVNNNMRQNGAFGLSSALEKMRKDDGLIGICLNGERFNISTPSSFQRATNEYGVYQ